MASIIKRCPKGNFTSELLNQCSDLFVVSLNNKYRHIKNGSIQLWNATFGQTNLIKYPPSLLPVLLNLKSQLVLPSLPQEKSLDKGSLLPVLPQEIEEGQVDQGLFYFPFFFLKMFIHDFFPSKGFRSVQLRYKPKSSSNSQPQANAPTSTKKRKLSPPLGFFHNNSN